ncbi:MAG: hypothetical protein R2873_06650 [Caldilineaceae bacterium]
MITALWLTASYPVALRGVHSAAYSAYLLLIVIGITLVGNRGGVLVTLGSLAVGAAAVHGTHGLAGYHASGSGDDMVSARHFRW